jgi:hypothetical protein
MPKSIAELPAYMKQYRIKNKERLDARIKELQILNKEIYNTTRKKWYRANRERLLAESKERVLKQRENDELQGIPRRPYTKRR